METLVRPTRGARMLTSREPPARLGALETMVPAVYVRRFPVATETATAETAESAAVARKPRNVRPRKPRNAGRQK
jgi:hypothetical protein